ncbi:MAG: sigma-54-dependent Fis family transcriptional regulator, partial [Sandaracinaceae bacterium]|nr:sigma-54-dependent Fis family transcriptional regulator [Sandaracinaceae bacterium]
WDRCRATLPPELHDAFARHPDRAALGGAVAPVPERPAAPPRAELERILELAGDVARARDPARILELAMDASIELLRAERGFVLLVADGELEVAVARNIDREHLARSGDKFSRSIAERVIAEGEVVLSEEARQDERFRGQRSIHAMRLRSVLCVPVRGPEGVLGALYVDNRFEAGRFGEDDARLLAGFADHVAIALTNARLTAALEQERAHIAARLDRATLEVERLSRRVVSEPGDFFGMIGRAPAMRALFATLERVAASSITALIQGESGSGKERVARAIHDASPRRDRPFVAINCGAIPGSLLESELFGHVRGAFTGAERDREGVLVSAGEGTLFLDEVGEMPEAMQVKLLRALEAREVRPVGARDARPLEARIVAATNRDLAREVEAGRFREDLYFRLAVVVLEVPPLRARREDIPFLARAIARGLEPPMTLAREALERLLAHDWPGNVRELDNALRAASVFAAGRRIEAADLRLAPPRAEERAPADDEARIRRALDEHGGNVSAVSRALSIPRMTLYRRLHAYGLR